MSCKLKFSKSCAIHTFTRYKVTFSRKKKARKRESFTKESFHEIVNYIFQTIGRFRRYVQKYGLIFFFNFIEVNSFKFVFVNYGVN